jgi:cytidylate kinase
MRVKPTPPYIPRQHPVVAIDGPAASGKGSISKMVARRLSVPCLDTGSIYRAVTWACLEAGIDLRDELACEKIASSIELEFKDGVVARVDGHNVSTAICSDFVVSSVSLVSSYMGVREELMPLQQGFVKILGGVVEGRDIGTTVLTNATAKVYLTADVSIRAERRSQQLKRTVVIEEIERRDYLDSTRSISPLVIAPDALVINTGLKELERCVSEIVTHVQNRLLLISR